ncbi:MAG: hypothetical protein ABI311_12845 [Gemmatimonadaceae bacterium]
MPQQPDSATTAGAQTIQAADRPFHRREPGIATLFLGLAIMLLTLILPMEHRTFAFYPALAVIGVGVFLTLRHGPDRSKND